VGLTGDNHVQVFDVSGAQPKIFKTIPTGAGAHAFRAAGDGRHVFVGNRVANTVNKIDYVNLESVQQFAAPGGPDCMEVSSDGKLLYVSSRWIKKMSETAYNELNQITGISGGGRLRFSGTTSEAADVSVQGRAARMLDASTFTADAEVVPGVNTIPVVATDGNGNRRTNNYQVI
jgi:DNA-binding beta-propeller fold protein YncE